jgi:hypothetical protein
VWVQQAVGTQARRAHPGSTSPTVRA